MHIIGRGRYTRETYPERGPINGGVLKVGYDQPIETQMLSSSGLAQLPRDLALNPLQVQLSGISPGNVLEVDCTASFTAQETDRQINTFVAVSFSLAPPPLGAGWFAINMSRTTRVIPGSIASAPQLRNFAGVLIPDGVSDVSVRVVYATEESDLTLFGIDTVEGPLTTLKASEVSKRVVQQVGPSVLIAL
jgi:hypothetical protein